jgi:uncharacterized protein YdiU (UPF0061 family)
LWNLTRLAESLLPLLAENTEAAVDVAQHVLKTYIEAYERYWLSGMRRKLGLTAIPGAAADESDRALIQALLNTMADNRADFTLTFFYLSKLSKHISAQDDDLRDLFDNPQEFDEWAVQWRQRLSAADPVDEQRQADMRSVNPVYIPRNHLIEAAIRAAEDHGDFSVFHELHEVLQDPFHAQEGMERYQLPPEPDEVVRQTFCGT